MTAIPPPAAHPSLSDLNGHLCYLVKVRNPAAVTATWHCADCDTTTERASFKAGTRGCPGRPESLDYLQVCGMECPGHMDTTTEDWRTWKASNSMPSDLVPKIFCDSSPGWLVTRAGTQWVAYADRIGLKMSVWAAQIFRHAALHADPAAAVFQVAELTFKGETYSVWVTRSGQLSCRKGTGAA